MTSENTVTGRNGNLSVAGTEIARITQWSLNLTLASSSEWGDSDSGGYTNRASGRRDATFSAEGKYDSTADAYDTIVPGTIAAAVLSMNATKTWTFDRALCSDFGLSVNVDTEEVIGWTAEFGADGSWTAPTA